jgi:hypothetical protein
MIRSIFKLFGTGGSGSAIEVPTLGNLKSGLQTADHEGWILLNGRLKSTLSAPRQAVATSLGIGANLPDATGRALVQGALSQLIGSSSIAQNQLPNVTTSFSNLPIVYGGSINTDNGTSGISGIPAMDNATTATTGWPLGATQQTSSINGGVTQQNYIPAAIGCNHFVYLGA